MGLWQGGQSSLYPQGSGISASQGKGMGQIAIIACGSKKAKEASPAIDLYKGVLFMKHRAWAEAFCDQIYIISARHGLISPSKIIKPYETSLRKFKKKDRDRWGSQVADQIRSRIPISEKLIFLAGEIYYRPIIRQIPHDYEIPFKRYGLGHRYALIDKLLSNENL